MATVIALRFAAGQYHATPWDRHVNEASVEWPPSLWRILRGLIAVWYRKLPEVLREPEVKALIELLAAERPSYCLPATTTAHTRQFMPIRKGRGETTTLVFDGFLCIDRDEELVVVWPALVLTNEQREAFSRLLSGLSYLGRAESWVEARLLDDWHGELNCAPLQTEPVEEGIEVLVLTTEPPEEYSHWRDEQLDVLGLGAGGLNAGQARLLASLPEDLFGALQLDTEDVRAQGWSRHPGAKETPYWCRPPEPLRRPSKVQDERRTTSARLTLSGKPLPRIEDAIKIGEIVRRGLIHHAGRVTNGDGDIPCVITGHGLGPHNRHEHAFYLPGDADRDGHIDHVVVHALAGLDAVAMQAIARLKSVWLDRGSEWAVTLDAYGAPDDLGEGCLIGSSTTWTSATPYLHPWHRKSKFGIEDQIRRECRERGLPVPGLERLNTIRVRGRDRRPVHFYRFRSRGKRGAVQPDTQGSFWRLTFPEPVAGPLALGTNCHFGLGIFEREA